MQQGDITKAKSKSCQKRPMTEVEIIEMKDDPVSCVPWVCNPSMKIRSTSGSPRTPRKSGSTSNSDQIGNFECRCNLVADAVRTDVKVIVRENDYLTLALGKTSIVAFRKRSGVWNQNELVR